MDPAIAPAAPPARVAFERLPGLLFVRRGAFFEAARFEAVFAAFTGDFAFGDPTEDEDVPLLETFPVFRADDDEVRADFAVCDARETEEREIFRVGVRGIVVVLVALKGVLKVMHR